MSHFQTDLSQETHVIDFVNHKFSPYLKKKCNAEIEVVDDMERQMKGIDLCIKNNKTVSFVDVKAQMNTYIGNPTETFCLELSYLKDGKIKEGWFLKDGLETTSYALSWIHTASYKDIKKERLIESEHDIKNMEIMFVNKPKIISYLEKIGLTKETLNKIQQIQRDKNIKRLYYNYETKKLFMEKNQPSLTLVKSDHLQEEPINLVIGKKTWSEICDAHYIVTDSNIETIKEHGRAS